MSLSLMARRYINRAKEAEAAVARAEAVVSHWRTKAEESEWNDEQITARLDLEENRSIVSYVPAADALRLAADRLEKALRGEDQ